MMWVTVLTVTLIFGVLPAAIWLRACAAQDRYGERCRLADDADRQHKAFLEGDDAFGIYGRFQP